MDRNSIIGLLLIGLILIGFSFWNQPSAEELAARQKQMDSIEAVRQKEKLTAAQSAKPVAAPALTDTLVLGADTTISADSLKSIQLREQFGSFAEAANGTTQFYTLENDVMKVIFSNKGGRVHHVELKKYKTFDQKPLLLFGSDSTTFGLNFFAQNRNVATNNLYFEPVQGKNKIDIYRT